MKNIRSHTPKFWTLHLALPVLLALLLAFVYPSSGIDAWLTARFYDANTLTFPLKSDWFLERILHQGLKELMVVISLLMLSLWLLGFKLGAYARPKWLLDYHRQFIWVFIAMLVSTSAIAILKHASNYACPWDLMVYGGNKVLIPLFASLPAGAKPGHCFPGGHASGGFALVAFYFAFRDSVPKLARAGLIAAIVVGSVMGWAQMMRGAHFMSHNLWTAWIVWMIVLGLYLLWPPQSVGRNHQSSNRQSSNRQS